MVLTNFPEETTNQFEATTNEFGWWVEVVTAVPSCTYYFGPFASIQEADLAQVGFFDDLKQEGAKGITIQIKQCQPRRLTVFQMN